jgi:WD40 repeat protein
MSKDGKRLASGDDDGNVQVWDVKNGGKLGKQIKVKSFGSQVWSVAFHPKNNNLIAIGNDNSNVILWDIEEDEITRLTDHSSRIWSVAFSPDGEILASGSDDRSIKLWELSSNKCFATLIRPGDKQSRVWCVVFSDDGKYLFSANDDGKIDMWVKNDDDSCEQKYTYKYKEDFEVEHSKHRLWSIAVNPSNTKLVSGSDDGTVRLWDIQTGSSIEIAKNHETIPQHEGWVCTVAFSPDGNSIASGGKDGVIRVFNLETKNLQHLKKQKPYDEMNISGAEGIDKSQIRELVRLGAIHEESPE